MFNSPRPVPMPSERDALRFQKYISVEPNSGCWLWTGPIAYRHPQTAGYGTFHMQGSGWRAHRVSYMLHKGEIPQGLVLDHKCRVTCCVNPEHLEAVTHRENTVRGNAGRDKIERERRRTHCIRGHEYTPENLYSGKSARGGRNCKLCARIRAIEAHKERSRIRAAVRALRALQPTEPGKCDG